MKNKLFLFLFFLLTFYHILNAQQQTNIALKAKETLAAVELDKGDTLFYTTKNGYKHFLTVKEVSIEVVFSTLDDLEEKKRGAGVIYSMSCKVNIDGQEMTMKKYIPVQQSYYEPYIVNGMRIWYDGNAEAGEIFKEVHGECVPSKDTRFAIQDMTMDICPEKLTNWYPQDENILDVGDAYDGDDTWMGTYHGVELHGGLDVNMSINTQLWAPLGFDEHFYFNSVKAGDNNNRWRGIKKWENGDVWKLQTHHMVDLFVPEYNPIKKGDIYGITAGVWYGSHPHTHFVFRIDHGDGDIMIDPWVLFWQIFENNRKKAGETDARMSALKPSKTGEAVRFFSKGSTKGITGNTLKYYWTFGDGGYSTEPNPQYTYQKPGIYPVTLVVDDGVNRDAITQHITINGEPQKKAALVINADDYTFIKRKNYQIDVYGKQPEYIPHTINFNIRPAAETDYLKKYVFIENTAIDPFWDNVETSIEYIHGGDWLNIVDKSDGVNEQKLKITINPTTFEKGNGHHEAVVTVAHKGVLNSPQKFRVRVNVTDHETGDTVIVDNQDENCIQTPYYWLVPEFCFPWTKGYNGEYMLGTEKREGEFVRYYPQLKTGTYEVFLKSPAYNNPKLKEKVEGFYTRINFYNGNKRMWMEPQKSLKIGEFKFKEGEENYVEIISDKARGLIIADAVVFVKK